MSFITYKPISSLKFTFPEHTAQIATDCHLALTSWFALPVVDDLRKTWSGIKKSLDLLRKFSLILGNSPNQIQSVIAVMDVKNGLIRERDLLQSELLAATDPVDQAITRASIVKLDQKIGDKNCGEGLTDCGLTLVLRNLESCSGSACDSFIGEARGTIDSELSDVKAERDTLARFIEAEQNRILKLNQSIDQTIKNIRTEIAGDQHEG